MSNSSSLASNQSAVEGTIVNDSDASKYFAQEKYAPLNVRGNFLTLCACPKNVELGEWLAHQSKLCRIPILLRYRTDAFLHPVVEQNRLLHGMLQVIQEVNSHTGLPICNETTCPTMSAGRYV